MRNLCYVGNYGAAKKIAECRLNPAAVVYDSRTRSYWVADLRVKLDPAHHALLSGVGHALALKRAGVRFANSGGEVIAQTPMFRVAVENEDEVFILREVVANGAYNLTPSAPGAVVLDIGMNAGFAALQFASQPRVAAVWAYEPVAASYGRAIANFGRNPELALKIKPHNYGLNDRDGEMRFDYAPDWKGVAGVNGISPEFQHHHRIEQVSRVSVMMRNVGDVIRRMRVAYPSAELIVKSDCEGCEYRIVAALQREGLLPEIYVFLIEWHERGPAELLRTLAGAGFGTLCSTPAEQTGMIYAWRQARA